MMYSCLMKDRALITSTAEKMIAFSKGNTGDINHFLKVWSYTRTIALGEGLDEHSLFVLELTAIVHDISCPLCREKYGNTDGKHQEEESPALISSFFSSLDVRKEDVERISFLVSRHHTYTDVNAPDWQILLEADYLVNADERGDKEETIRSMREKVFRTETGKRLLESIYLDKSSL